LHQDTSVPVYREEKKTELVYLLWSIFRASNKFETFPTDLDSACQKHGPQEILRENLSKNTAHYEKY
jgi:hypothetical protein